MSDWARTQIVQAERHNARDVSAVKCRNSGNEGAEHSMRGLPRRPQDALGTSRGECMLGGPFEELRQRTGLKRRLFQPAGSDIVVLGTDHGCHRPFEVRHLCDLLA
jgi:hypothetical protein